MGTTLHAEVAARAKQFPAILVGQPILVALLARRLIEAVARFKSQFQQYPLGTGKVQIGLVDCTYGRGPTSPQWDIVLSALTTHGMFQFECNEGFDVYFSVTQNGVAAAGLFVVELHVKKVSALVRAGYNVLSIKDVNFDFDSRTVEDGDLLANASAIGLSERDVAKLEGLVEGSVAPTALKNIFSGAPDINLPAMFPAIAFNGQTDLMAMRAGLLIIARDGWHLV